MNNFFKSTTFKVLVSVAIILLSATVLATVVSNSTSPLTNVISIITTPLQDVASTYDRAYGWATTRHGIALKRVQRILDKRKDTQKSYTS